MQMKRRGGIVLGGVCQVSHFDCGGDRSLNEQLVWFDHLLASRHKAFVSSPAFEQALDHSLRCIKLLNDEGRVS
jgi:hypothetical protein